MFALAPPALADRLAGRRPPASGSLVPGPAGAAADGPEAAVPVERLGGAPGAGPPAAFIHGLLCSNAMWRTPAMAPLLARCDAVALPLPGHHPWALPAGRALSLLAGDRLVGLYAGALRRTFGGRPVRLVGHSTGAMLALELARRHPDLVAGVCAVGALGSGRRLGGRSLVREIACLPLLGGAAFRLMLRRWLSGERAFRAGLRSAMGARPPGGEMPRGVLRDLARSDPRALHAVALWVRRCEGVGAPERVRAPVLGIVCAQDPVVAPAHQIGLLRSLGRARAVLLASGHLPMVERPELFAAILDRWLRAEPGQPAHPDRRRPRGGRGTLAPARR